MNRYKKNVLALIAGVLLTLAGGLAYAGGDHGRPAVDRVHGALSVMVLGSAGPQIMAGTGRASAGYLVFTDGKPRVLMDLGGGTFERIAKSGAHIHSVSDILISHLHIDHSSELPAVIKGLYFDGRIQGSPVTQPLQIWGPDNARHLAHFKPLSDYLAQLFGSGGLFAYMKSFVDNGRLGHFGYQAHDLNSDFHNASIRTLVDRNGLVIKAIAVDHFDTPAVAYRIEYKGHSIVYTGDTHSTTDNLERLARGADLLIYDTSILDNAPPPPSAFAKRHTTPTRLGQVAAAADPRELVLSHLTPVSLPNIHSIEHIVRNQGYAGKISEAQDLKVYNVADDDE